MSPGQIPNSVIVEESSRLSEHRMCVQVMYSNIYIYIAKCIAF